MKLRNLLLEDLKELIAMTSYHNFSESGAGCK